MAIKAARVPYLNYEPFYYDMERRGIELYEMPPSSLAPALEEGEIDAAPAPLVDYFRLEDGFQPVAGFCVSALDRARSVLLCSKRPMEELTGASIAVISETSTALRLLQVLLALKYRVEPGAYNRVETPNPGENDAILLIGNHALRRRRGLRGFPHRYDLGEEWHQWTGLPFVFARWVARKDMEPKDLALLEDTLYVGLEEGVDGLYHLNEPREDLLMLPKDIVEYIQGIRYFVGLSEQKGIDLFRKYVEQLKLDCQQGAAESK